jgi:hypothetical protein
MKMKQILLFIASISLAQSTLEAYSYLYCNNKSKVNEIATFVHEPTIEEAEAICKNKGGIARDSKGNMMFTWSD